MGAKSYYLKSPSYPEIYKALMQRLELYFMQTIYTEDEYSSDAEYNLLRKKRIQFGDFVGGGFDEGGRANIQQNSNNQLEIPYTAYWLDDTLLVDELKNYYAGSGNYFSDTFDAYVQYVPFTVTFPAVTVFATKTDYFRVRQIFDHEDAYATRLTVPVTINKQLTSFEANVSYEIAKGDYAFASEEHRTYGKLYDLSHTITMAGSYFRLIGNEVTDPNDPNGGKIIINPYPVDDIILSLNQLNDLLQKESSLLINTTSNYETPIISNSSIVEGSVNISKTATIDITFNIPMKEITVEGNIDFLPLVDYRTSWNDNSTVLTIIPFTEWEGSTEYTLLINNSATSGYDIPLEDDYTLTFTTEA